MFLRTQQNAARITRRAGEQKVDRVAVSCAALHPGWPTGRAARRRARRGSISHVGAGWPLNAENINATNAPEMAPSTTMARRFHPVKWP